MSNRIKGKKTHPNLGGRKARILATEKVKLKKNRFKTVLLFIVSVLEFFCFFLLMVNFFVLWFFGGPLIFVFGPLDSVHRPSSCLSSIVPFVPKTVSLQIWLPFFCFACSTIFQKKSKNTIVNLKSNWALLYNKGHNLLTSVFHQKIPKTWIFPY